MNSTADDQSPMCTAVDRPLPHGNKRKTSEPLGVSTVDDTHTLVSQAMDVVESVVNRCANHIMQDLKASYEREVYADLLFSECNAAIAELNIAVRVEKNILVPIIGLGRALGILKVPFAFYSKSGRPLLLLEVKTKKTALKEADLETMGCMVEQISRSTEQCHRPRAILVNFAFGVHSSIVLHTDGNITN